jgi:hypothetical protein
VHIRAGEVLLTFTPAEFAAFTESVNDCYWRQEILGLAELDQPAGIPPATPDDDVIN